MVPTLQIGQRVLVNRIGNRFTDPKVGEVIVFHPPKGSDTDTCGDGNRRQGQACDKPTAPPRRTSTSSSASSACPGDTIYVKGGHVYRNGKRESDAYISRTCESGDGRGCNFTTPITIPARPLVHDGRQPWRVRRQPLLGPGPAQMDHRRRLRDLLAAQAHRPPLALAPGAGARAAPQAAGSIRRSGRYGDGRRDRTRRRARGRLSSHAGSRHAVAPAEPVAGTAGGRPPSPRADQAPHGPPALPVRPRPGRALDRRAPTRPGAGCLAGPLVAAAVLFDVEALGVREVRALTALNDSKQHDRRGARGALPGRHAHRRQGRRRLALRARHRRLRPAQDEPRRAARRARRRRAARGACAWSTASRCPTFGHEQRPIVDGDATSAAIAAASIVAKVTRDRFMHRADALHPGWEFRSPRRLLDARAPRRDPAPGRLAAAPALLPEHRVPAAGALGARRPSERRLEVVEAHELARARR